MHTLVTYWAPAPNRRTCAMNASSSIAAVVPNPPGTQITSQRSTFARSARSVKVSPSASMS